VTGSSLQCINGTSGLLTLTGNVGAIVKWQSSTSPFSAWTDIVNTLSTYTSGSLTETTQFRVVVQSGSCGQGFSSPATVTISPARSGVLLPEDLQSVLVLRVLTYPFRQCRAVVKWQSSVSPFSTWKILQIP